MWGHLNFLSQTSPGCRKKEKTDNTTGESKYSRVICRQVEWLSSQFTKRSSIIHWLHVTKLKQNMVRPSVNANLGDPMDHRLPKPGPQTSPRPIYNIPHETSEYSAYAEGLLFQNEWGQTSVEVTDVVGREVWWQECVTLCSDLVVVPITNKSSSLSWMILGHLESPAAVLDHKSSPGLCAICYIMKPWRCVLGSKIQLFYFIFCQGLVPVHWL